MDRLLYSLLRQLQTGDIVLGISLGLLAVWLACAVVPLLLRRQLPRMSGAGGFALQVGIALGLEQAYEVTRGQIPLRTDVAFLNAYRLLDIEWRHGFFVESRIERFFLHYQLVMTAVDLFYIVAHAAVTIGVLAWVYIWHRRHYPFVRNMLAITTGIALVAFYLYPTAPPRLLTNYSFVDPLQLHHLVGAGGAQPGSFTYNPYAAMPSLHVAYALISGWAVALAVRHPAIRAGALLYPLLMAATVIISGNHWILDVVGAGVTVLISALALYALRLAADLPVPPWRPGRSALGGQRYVKWESLP